MTQVTDKVNQIICRLLVLLLNLSPAVTLQHEIAGQAFEEATLPNNNSILHLYDVIIGGTFEDLGEMWDTGESKCELDVFSPTL